MLSVIGSMCCRYGSGDPKIVFVERKTHRESWKGEESVKERIVLAEENVVPFLEQAYTIEQAEADLRAKVCSNYPAAWGTARTEAIPSATLRQQYSCSSWALVTLCRSTGVVPECHCRAIKLANS